MAKAIAISLEKQKTAQQKIAEVFENEARKLFSFIKQRVPTHTDAEDIMQDVFYSYTETVMVSDEINSAGAWLYKVAKNKITDMFRKKKNLLLEDVFTKQEDEENSSFYEDVIEDKSAQTEQKISQKFYLKEIETALENIPAEQREIFIEQEINGKTFKQISEETGEKIPTLLSRKRYAVMGLRKHLKDVYKEI